MSNAANDDLRARRGASYRSINEADDRIDSGSEEIPELIIYSRSNIFYWWPVWLFGFVAALLTWLGGARYLTENGREILVHPSASLGLTFLIILVLVITFTNVALRGGYSVFFILSIAFIVVLLGWIGWLDDAFNLVPQLSVFMNFGFYATFSTLLFLIWALRFFIFDRMTYWVVRPGQLVYTEVIGGAEESYDTRGLLFEEVSDDFIRYYVLGLGSGDLKLHTAGAREREIYIPNVLFANAKVKEIQRLINIQPDERMATSVR